MSSNGYPPGVLPDRGLQIRAGYAPKDPSWFAHLRTPSARVGRWDLPQPVTAPGCSAARPSAPGHVFLLRAALPVQPETAGEHEDAVQWRRGMSYREEQLRNPRAARRESETQQYGEICSSASWKYWRLVNSPRNQPSSFGNHFEQLASIIADELLRISVHVRATLLTSHTSDGRDVAPLKVGARRAK
jgi:hypothetical protein